MKYLIIVLIALTLVFAGCEQKTTKLTSVDINSIKVPADFNFETTRPVDIYVFGLYKQTAKITTLDGTVLTRGLVDPIDGMISKVTLPYSVRQVKVIYGTETAIVNVSALNRIEKSFLPIN